MEMGAITVLALRPGYSVIYCDGCEIGTAERSYGHPTPSPGMWFVYPSPSGTDALAYQHDRAPHAVAWARTRRDVVNRFLRWIDEGAR